LVVLALHLVRTVGVAVAPVQAHPAAAVLVVAADAIAAVVGHVARAADVSLAFGGLAATEHVDVATFVDCTAAAAAHAEGNQREG
jgi:hypothetical protein